MFYKSVGKGYKAYRSGRERLTYLREQRLKRSGCYLGEKDLIPKIKEILC